MIGQCQIIISFRRIGVQLLFTLDAGENYRLRMTNHEVNANSDWCSVSCRQA